MATTQLADVYVPTTFNRRVQLAQIERNAFIRSGIAVRDPLLAEQFAAGGRIGELPQYNGITIVEPNYSSDEPGNNATPQKITSNVQKVRSASRNQHWSTMDLARDLADSDPMGAVTGRIGSYWATDDESRVINALYGILADNVANDAGDMLYSVATDDAGAVTDAERISSQAIAFAAQTLGDHSADLTGIAMHSVQRTRLVAQGLIKEHRDDKNGELMFETYLGLVVTVDDSLTPTIGTNRITYTVVLLGSETLGWANGKVTTPSELTREALSGDGGGQTIVSSRVNTILHPNGFSFLSASVAGPSATYAELKNAANWDRVVPRKNVKLAFLQVND